jgi:hypothetical protein
MRFNVTGCQLERDEFTLERPNIEPCLLKQPDALLPDIRVDSHPYVTV